MNALLIAIKELEAQKDKMLEMATEASDEDYEAALTRYNEVVSKLERYKRVAGIK